ncbi:hypothetical protein Xcel_2064 [Xylanimonas cellulosilytica DSM 15894]|uniref:Uncharacterized protein n=1 Tax=Xylanimonas cellulosilytica (strain DSM 15894 / JCM 12276 / CECT 5975 / KCTC 9989 / LMG 20990 / NBRC 107835 / XIL07) TaxID=446471 RepID=D1BU69_XYLCX|nr:hypothetical protein [Xylanimonas cellulosilytica]ACZ31082.1 hypothetical protein Xcel_2064 [Xylanimonas cellulosilytica DSM 15894]
MTPRQWPWWWVRRQPDPPEELNEPDAEHPVRVVTRRDRFGQVDEAVYARPEAAADWDERLWW